MTSIMRRVGMLALVLLLGLFAVAGGATTAGAQEETDECYPVPPGGCPTPTPTETEPEPEPPSCQDILEAIEAGDTSMDQNGDGEINAEDLPEECTCDELIEAVEAGIISEDDLPEECVEADVEVEQTEPEPPAMADTGIDASGLATLTVLALLGGGSLLVLVRRREA